MPINNPKKIKFRGTKAYVLSENTIVIANVNTFEEKLTNSASHTSVYLKDYSFL